MSKPKTAMVVANSADLRNGLRERVCRQGDLEVIAISPRGELAVHRLKRSKPDTAVVSANLDGHELNKLASDLRKHTPGLLVIIYDVNAAPDSGRFQTQSDPLERRSTLQAIAAFSVRDGTERSTPGPLHTGIVDSESGAAWLQTSNA
jgi:hypothetical protein